MAEVPLPKNETQRLRALRELGLLDTPPEERFDRLTRLAKRLFDVPVALVSLVDADRQWFKSNVGFDAEQTSREVSFCSHAILEDGVTVVSDATGDPRFNENPLVLNAPEIRFYAGCPVRAPDGSSVGTLCIIDHRPRELEGDDARLLRDLAELVENELRAVRLATLDELTGLTNRRGLYSIAEHALALSRRLDRPATCLLFDLDEFKQINDTLGHAAGDSVIQAFAERLLSAFRDSDVVARIGGDEFCVLLGGATGASAAVALTHLDASLEGADPPIRYSVGVAEYDAKRHSSVGALMEEADRLMYEEKDRLSR